MDEFKRHTQPAPGSWWHRTNDEGETPTVRKMRRRMARARLRQQDRRGDKTD